jgi:hypothetical protein
MTKNSCHSLSRFNCYIVDKALQTEKANVAFNTVNAHLYYKAVDCAKSVLAGGFIQYSLFIAFAVIAFLF